MNTDSHDFTLSPAAANDASLAGRLVTALSKPGGFVAFVTVLMLVLFGLRVGLFPATGGDDAEQILFAQQFAWGYDIRNPPFYTWLVIASQAVFGVSIAAVEIVKFTLLWLTPILFLAAARQVLASATMAALTALSPFALYYVAWDAVLGYSHSVLLMAMCVATFLALLRIDRTGDVLSYVLFGVCVAVGTMAKYGFALFAITLIAAAMTDVDLRHRILNPRFLIALLVTVLVIIPHGLWALNWITENPGGLESRLAEKMEVADQAMRLMTAWKGAFAVLSAIAGFLLPLGVIALAFFPKAVLRNRNDNTMAARYRRILGIFIVLLLAAILVSALASGATRVRTHYMFVFILLPLYFFLRVEAAGYTRPRTGYFAVVLVVLAVLPAIALPTKFFIDPWRCDRCDLYVPFADLSRQLKESGFERGTIIAFPYPLVLAGNLKVHFPDSRVISFKHPDFIPPAQESPEPCMMVWYPGHGANMDGWAKDALGLDRSRGSRTGTVEASIPVNSSKTIQLQYRLFDGEGIGCK